MRPSVVEPSEVARVPAIEAAAAGQPDPTAPAVVDQVAVDEPDLPVPTPIPPKPAAPDGSPDSRLALRDEAQLALAETRRALADSVHALSEELAGLARRGIDTSARAAIGMLGARNLADALAVNTGFARASFGNWAGSAAKLSELGVRFAAECSRPFIERPGSGCIAPGHAER